MGYGLLAILTSVNSSSQWKLKFSMAKSQQLPDYMLSAPTLCYYHLLLITFTMSGLKNTTELESYIVQVTLHVQWWCLELSCCIRYDMKLLGIS